MNSSSLKRLAQPVAAMLVGAGLALWGLYLWRRFREEGNPFDTRPVYLAAPRGPSVPQDPSTTVAFEWLRGRDPDVLGPRFRNLIRWGDEAFERAETSELLHKRPLSGRRGSVFEASWDRRRSARGPIARGEPPPSNGASLQGTQDRDSTGVLSRVELSCRNRMESGWCGNIHYSSSPDPRGGRESLVIFLDSPPIKPGRRRFRLFLSGFEFHGVAQAQSRADRIGLHSYEYSVRIGTPEDRKARWKNFPAGTFPTEFLESEDRFREYLLAELESLDAYARGAILDGTAELECQRLGAVPPGADSFFRLTAESLPDPEVLSALLADIQKQIGEVETLVREHADDMYEAVVSGFPIRRVLRNED